MRGGLATVVAASDELIEALDSLLAESPTPALPTTLAARRRGKGGRPSRAQASGKLAAIAPFPELVTLPTTLLHRHIRAITDPQLLQRAHAFEGEHLRRRAAFAWLEDQLRFLGSPLGGPSEPLPGYDETSVEELVAAVRYRDSVEFAARVYAYEYYRRRRQPLLHAAERLCGERGRELVLRTAPRRGGSKLAEPLPGFAQLSTAPHARVELRNALAACSRSILERTLSYEQETRRRKTMLEAIEVALRRTPVSATGMAQERARQLAA